MPLSFRIRNRKEHASSTQSGDDIFGDRINLGELGDGFVKGKALEDAYVQLDNGSVVSGRVSILPIVWDQGRPGRCFAFIPKDSDQQYQFSDVPIQIQTR